MRLRGGSRTNALGKFEVTFAEWDACVAAGSCKNLHDSIFSRVLRGGSWSDDPRRLRSANREKDLIGYHIIGITYNTYLNWERRGVAPRREGPAGKRLRGVTHEELEGWLQRRQEDRRRTGKWHLRHPLPPVEGRSAIAAADQARL
jgi:hypothetical protein